MTYESVLLLNPRMTWGEPYVSGATPHMGLMVLATACRQKGVGNVSIKDSLASEDLDSLLDSVTRNTLIGFSTTLFNYPECLRLASMAKTRGATVVFGGPYVTSVGDSCLRNRREVDYVCLGEGESCLPMLASGSRPDLVPNLLYRDANGAPKTSGAREHAIDSLPILHGHHNYVTDINRKLEARCPESFFGYFPIMSHKGCQWRTKMGCIFCSITSIDVQFMSPSRFWRHIDSYKAEYAATHFRDMGDTVGMNSTWLATLVERRPAHLAGQKFLMYCRADEFIQPQVARNLKDLNVSALYVGFESGSPKSLKGLAKGCSLKTNRRALILLREWGFKLYTSFVLGAPGETEESIGKTHAFIEEIREIMGHDLIMLGANILIPYPGTAAFDMLADNCPEFLGQDSLDPWELTYYWVKSFCDFSSNRKYWHQNLLRISEEVNSSAHSSVALLGRKG